jgi:hypothetical protein
MCEISDKIKFCTCNGETLKHYWVLHRKIENRELYKYYLGSVVEPSKKEKHFFPINNKTLEKRLNEIDVFDVPMNFKNKDVLEIVINNKSKDYEDCFTYAFQFNKGKWKSIEYDFFLLMNKFDETVSGKMKNVLKRK